MNSEFCEKRTQRPEPTQDLLNMKRRIAQKHFPLRELVLGTGISCFATPDLPGAQTIPGISTAGKPCALTSWVQLSAVRKVLKKRTLMSVCLFSYRSPAGKLRIGWGTRYLPTPTFAL